MEKVRAQLKRAISHHISGWNMCILSWRSRWKCYTTSLECKQPENVLLLMKVLFTIFWFITLCVLLFTWISNKTLVISSSSGHIWLFRPYTLGKQNLSYVWFLKPCTLGKLIFHDIFLSVKQNLSYVWFLRPYTLGKLILHGIFLSVKQNLSYTWFLGPHTLDKLMLYIILLSIKQNLGHAWFLGPYTLGKLIFSVISLSVKNRILVMLASSNHIFWVN